MEIKLEGAEVKKGQEKQTVVTGEKQEMLAHLGRDSGRHVTIKSITGLFESYMNYDKSHHNKTGEKIRRQKDGLGHYIEINWDDVKRWETAMKLDTREGVETAMEFFTQEREMTRKELDEDGYWAWGRAGDRLEARDPVIPKRINPPYTNEEDSLARSSARHWSRESRRNLKDMDFDIYVDIHAASAIAVQLLKAKARRDFKPQAPASK